MLLKLCWLMFALLVALFIVAISPIHTSAPWRGFPIVCTSARNCGRGAPSPSSPDKNEQMAQVLFYPYRSFRTWLASQPIRT